MREPRDVEYPKSNQQVSNKYIKEINIQRTPKTKFEILEDNKSIEGIFLLEMKNLSRFERLYLR